MRFETRPSAGRAEFEAKAAPHKTAVGALAAASTSTASTIDPTINEYIKDNAIWGEVKPAFMAAQHRKCGYCEVKITEAAGDVEHFRPKNALWELTAPGAELEDLVNQRGRKYNKRFDSGYYWLAYDWDNYLVACATCNQRWKSALFPVQARRTRAPQEGDEHTEHALLLDPFGPLDPAAHLTFGVLGDITQPVTAVFLVRKLLRPAA